MRLRRRRQELISGGTGMGEAGSGGGGGRQRGAGACLALPAGCRLHQQRTRASPPGHPEEFLASVYWPLGICLARPGGMFTCSFQIGRSKCKESTSGSSELVGAFDVDAMSQEWIAIVHRTVWVDVIASSPG